MWIHTEITIMMFLLFSLIISIGLGNAVLGFFSDLDFAETGLIIWYQNSSPSNDTAMGNSPFYRNKFDLYAEMPFSS